MGKPRAEVVCFAVGGPDEPRSRVWRVWTTKGKSDLYISGRQRSQWRSPGPTALGPGLCGPLREGRLPAHHGSRKKFGFRCGPSDPCRTVLPRHR